MTNEARKLDWNDLHVSHGLEAVREQLAQALTLPRAPSEEAPADHDLSHTLSEGEPGADGAAPAPEGGQGARWDADKVFQRFALIEVRGTEITQKGPAR